MSPFYESNWKYLQTTYKRPANFSDRCDWGSDHAIGQAGIALVKCNSICIKMYETAVVGGRPIRKTIANSNSSTSGFPIPGFIRGCFDEMLVRGFNQTLVKWYRWLQRDSCHAYSKKAVLQVSV